jgi:hypothetical protein
VATDAARETIPYVKVTYPTGQVKEYRAPDTTDQMISGGSRQTMDCRDCHNRVGHPFSASAEQGVDQAIAAGSISRDLPFVRREGVRLVKASYPSENEAMQAIESGLRSFYASQGNSAGEPAVSRSIIGLQDVYRRNVFPTMMVTFGAYPDNKGHITATGCFRCHDDSHTANDGSTIGADCELCHKQVEPTTESARSSPTESAARLQHLLTRSVRPGPPGGSQQGLSRNQARRNPTE